VLDPAFSHTKNKVISPRTSRSARRTVDRLTTETDTFMASTTTALCWRDTEENPFEHRGRLLALGPGDR
jgi:hypothetical protein